MAAAFTAAAGLHLLIFQIWPPFNALQLQTDEGSVIQVDLVNKASKQPSHPIETVKPPTPKKYVEQQPPVHVAQAAQPLPDRQNTAVEQPRQPASPAQQVTQVAYEPEPEVVSSPGAMPADVQRMILTRISYPRQARRKGWEGRAMFHLDIREHKLTRLDLFLSSGFALLDRAAMRGIRDVENHLPLANGLYSLPVEFRLQ